MVSSAFCSNSRDSVNRHLHTHTHKSLIVIIIEIEYSGLQTEKTHAGDNILSGKKVKK